MNSDSHEEFLAQFHSARDASKETLCRKVCQVVDQLYASVFNEFTASMAASACLADPPSADQQLQHAVERATGHVTAVAAMFEKFGVVLEEEDQKEMESSSGASAAESATNQLRKTAPSSTIDAKSDDEDEESDSGPEITIVSPPGSSKSETKETAKLINKKVKDSTSDYQDDQTKPSKRHCIAPTTSKQTRQSAPAQFSNSTPRRSLRPKVPRSLSPPSPPTKSKERSNTAAVSCPQCGRRCRTRHDLTRHMQFHTGERPFHCSHCSKCFTLRADCIKHERIHTGEKPWRCTWNGCGYAATNASSVSGHVRAIHFALPRSKKEQVELGIEDERDPRDFAMKVFD